ncbi:hypothetical protein Tco_0431503 [Tanacetum coccineum]
MVKMGLVEAIDSLLPLDEHLATFQGNGYSRKGQKESQKRQNRARNGNDKVKSKPKGTGYDNQRAVNVDGARENVVLQNLRFLKKAQKRILVFMNKVAFNDNLALMLTPDSDETIRLDKERPSKLSDLIRPFDYDQLNNLYDLFVPQRETSAEQHYFPKTSKMSQTSSNNEFSKVSFRKQPTLLEKRMDESIPWDQKHSQISTGNSKNIVFDENRAASREYYYVDLDEVTNLQCDYLETLKKCKHLEKELSKSRTMSKSFEALQKHAINLELDLQQCKEKIKNDKSFNKNQSNVFMKEREQYFEIQDLKAHLQDKGIAISTTATFSNSLAKKDFSKLKSVTTQNVSYDFSKQVTAQIIPQNVVANFQEHKCDHYQECIKRVTPNTSVSRPQLKSNQLEDRVMPNNSQGKKQNVEDHRRNFKFSNNKTICKLLIMTFECKDLEC